MLHRVRVFTAASILLAAPLGAPGCVAEDELTEETNTEDEFADYEAEEDEPISRASSTEFEPNNTSSQSGVRTIDLGVDNFGALSSSDTVDFWRLEVSTARYVNLFLGDIPSGNDFDLRLYKGGTVLWAGTNGLNQPEMKLWLPLQPGTYFLEVRAFGTPKVTSSYRLRAAATVISRAYEWVKVKMPYCQALGGEKDLFCGGDCPRTDAQKQPDWDVYRSDCSGYIAWAWALPSTQGGPTTDGLVNYFTQVITVGDLQPGDILLHPKSSGGYGHVFMFERWIDKPNRRALVLEEPDCNATARALEVTLSEIAATTTKITTPSDSRIYTARRRPI